MKSSILAFFAFGSACFAGSASEVITRVDVSRQKMVITDGDKTLAKFPVSTSKFGLGDRPGSYQTPLGRFMVIKKIGSNQPSGTVFKGGRPTGEIIRPNAPGRDPIVTRVFSLCGLDTSNSRAQSRGILIHGTPEESKIGHPASYGCIRLRSKDVIRASEIIPTGSLVIISAKG